MKTKIKLKLETDLGMLKVRLKTNFETNLNKR
jgi:hypothetical protein